MSEIINNSSIDLGIIIPIIISIFLVIIGVNENYKEKNYQKKYLMTVYFIISVLSAFITNVSIGSVIIYIFLIYTFISIIAAVNISYNIDPLTKRLSRFDLFKLKFFEWMFYIRSYMFIPYFGVLSFTFYCIRFFDNKYYLFYTVLGIFFLMYIIGHLLHNAKDNFDVHNFSDVKDCFIENVEKYNQLFSVVESNTDIQNKNIHDNNINFMGFIMYMEDKDLFDRKKFTFDIKIVRKRKKEKYKVKFRNKYNIEKRGYSTIPQQLIRNIVLKEGAYTKSNRHRRKIFVEWIYMPLFFKYYIKEREEYSMNVNGNKIKYTEDMSKVDILKCYFVKVSKKPKNKDELFNAMAKHSKKLKVVNYKFYYNEYLESKLRNKYIEKIESCYYRTYESL